MIFEELSAPYFLSYPSLFINLVIFLNVYKELFSSKKYSIDPFHLKCIFTRSFGHLHFKRSMDHFYSNLVVSNVRFGELAVITVLAIHDGRLRFRILLMKRKLMKWKLKGYKGKVVKKN